MNKSIFRHILWMLVTFGLAILIYWGLQWRATQNDLQDPDKVYVQAMLAFQHEDYGNALMYFKTLYALRPDDTSYYQWYATALSIQDPENPHLDALITALKMEPERNTAIWLLFAQAALRKGKPEDARQYYEEALKATPRFNAIE